MIAISSCLVGISCTYKGSNHTIDVLQQLINDGKAIAVCPEVLGGLSIPRDACEIVDNQVVSKQGKDYTKEYQRGANKVLELVKTHHITTVILKSKSPSCGKGYIYDGTFSHQLIKGDGITTKVLEQNGIIVYNEDTLDKFLKEIEKE